MQTILLSEKRDIIGSIKKAVSSIEYQRMGKTGIERVDDVDGVIFALSSKGMQSVVFASPELAYDPVFSVAASCPSIDVMSVRLWFDRIVPTPTPANVWSRFPELRGAGGTFFMLDQLQKSADGDFSKLWGNSSPLGSVVACDFYNAGALIPLSDADLIKIISNELLPAAVPAFGVAQVVDSWIGRYPGTVSWFAPGTFSKRPSLQGSPNIINLKCAGDWVRMGRLEHGAKGLCQERAYVSGLQAANQLLNATFDQFKRHVVLPVREDEPQFRAGVSLNNQVMKLLPRFWVR